MYFFSQTKKLELTAINLCLRKKRYQHSYPSRIDVNRLRQIQKHLMLASFMKILYYGLELLWRASFKPTYNIDNRHVRADSMI